MDTPALFQTVLQYLNDDLNLRAIFNYQNLSRRVQVDV